MNNPEFKLCSILIPAYNSQEYIIKALESVTKIKNYDQFINIHVVNDASNDTTEQLVNDYAKIHKNIYLYNKKLNGNWGSVINYAKNNQIFNSKYMMILDSDDLIHNNFLNVLIKKIDKDNLDFVLTKTTVIFNKIKVIINPKMFIKYHNQKIAPVLIPCSIVFKTHLFYQADDLIENVSYQDYPLFLDLLSKAKKFKVINRITATYWFTRPFNTMSSGWTKKRLKSEECAFSALKKINSSEFFIFKFLLPKFVKGLYLTNTKVYLSETKINYLLQNVSSFAKFLLKININKAIKNKNLFLIKEENSDRFELIENIKGEKWN
ncbi:glycosyltransferase family 2 protein [Mycoplasmopsis alligatoris]|uniref:Glycosyltransferase, group 2 family protein n=1 Tax=Mycoplasmopsis alligatoris A21JP2 TaxID=747682 RepID=D4XW64_9BACT|nr:glycosyltransferase [Mycoplasmopsis alligatoris]EFF41437.1 glycosyltransferase, group 2 family protein [Mycoplasmopsis alligatoris A21JP2]